MKFLLFLVSLLALSSATFAQSKNDDIVAQVGEKIITVEEFKNRFELTPQINRKSGNDQKAKEQLLYTIIAENLFALEAKNMGFDTLNILKDNYIPLEKMHVRDALYKSEISNNVGFNNEKFNEGIQLIDYKCFVDYVFSNEESNINKAFAFLNSGSNFDSLITLINYAEYVSEPYEVNYGQMYKTAEKEIYSLEINDFTQPIQSPDGWYIFRLLSKIPTNFTHEQKYSKVRQTVVNRIEDSVYNNYLSKFFSNKEVTTDGSLFWYLAEEVQSLVSKIKASENIKDGGKIKISDEQFSMLRNTLHSDSLKKVFIKFSEKPISLDQFFIEFMFEGFYTFTTDINTIAGQLNSRIKRQIELELIARDGYKRGMESLPEVKNSTQMWKNNYLSTLYLKDFIRNTELSDDEIESYIKKENGNSINETKINILEVLTDSLEVIKEALNFSENSDVFRKYASVHTKRDSLKGKGGEFGFFNSSENGEIGRIAEAMEIGDVYGPLETADGYSIFKVIDKRITKLDLKEIRKNKKIKNQLKYKKIMKNLENMAVELAEKHNVSVNNELLISLNLLNAQMIVFRNMGFGGQIQAFPYSTPFYLWKEKWEQKNKDIL